MVVHKMRALKAQGLRLGLLTINVKEFKPVGMIPPPVDMPPVTPPPVVPLTGNVTSSISAVRTGKRKAGNRVTFTYTLRNTSGSPIAGPLYFVLLGLPRKTARLLGGTVAPGSGSPAVLVNLPGGALDAGATVAAVLRISTKNGRNPGFTPQFLAG